jgi:GT2 family glycosyltransferase
VLDEARDIGRLLDELRRQAPPAGGFEVLVADGGSTDATRAIVTERARGWPGLRLLENPRRLSSAGRNVGARAARGQYVLFLDGHCALPRADYLTRTVELFESTGAACLCRPQPLDRIEESAGARAISAARHSWLGHNPGSDIYGGAPGFTDPRSAGAAYRRACIEQLGGYDERFDACEDVEFNHRVAIAGMTAYRHPDLSVPYRPRSSLSALWRQMARYGRGRARLWARHPSRVPWPLVLISAGGVAIPAVWLAAGPRAALALAATALVAWMLVVGAESLRLSGFAAGAARTMLAFAAIHTGLAAGFWRGLAEFPRYRSAPRR